MQSSPLDNIRDFQNFLDCSPWAISFTRITDGNDSIVWEHSGTNALLKQYNHRLTKLSQWDIEVYHQLHTRYSGQISDVAISSDWWLQYHETSLRWISVRVLDIWNSIYQDWEFLVSEIPRIRWENLLVAWDDFSTEMLHPKTQERVIWGYIILEHVKAWLESLGVPIQRFSRSHPKHKQGYNITRDNIMIEWMENWILNVCITDLGDNIRSAIQFWESNN